MHRRQTLKNGQNMYINGSVKMYMARIEPWYSLRGLRIHINWFSLYGIHITWLSLYGNTADV